MDELYRQYGELMIELEMIQAKIQFVKKQIVEAVNKKEAPKIVESSDPT